MHGNCLASIVVISLVIVMSESRAEHHADTNQPEVATAKKQIAAKLHDHKGPNNAISSKALADYSGLSASTVRDCIAEIRVEYDVPVVSRNQGYYVVESRDEFEAQLERMNDRIETIRERKKELASAWNTQQTRGESE